MAGVDLAAEFRDLAVIEEAPQDASAPIGGTAHEPLAGYPVAADPRALNRPGAELFEHQGGAQHRNAFAGCRGCGQYAGVGVGAASDHLTAWAESQGLGAGQGDRAKPAAAGADLRQGGAPGLGPDAASPALPLQIPTQPQVVALFSPAPISQQPTHQPIGLMAQQPRPSEPQVVG